MKEKKIHTQTLLYQIGPVIFYEVIKIIESIEELLLTNAYSTSYELINDDKKNTVIII